MSYSTILKRNILSWVISNHPKLAVQHKYAADKPLSLRSRLMNDLESSQHRLCKDFVGFLAHACNVSKAFPWSDPIVFQNCTPEEKPRRKKKFSQGNVIRPEGSFGSRKDARNKISICITVLNKYNCVTFLEGAQIVPKMNKSDCLKKARLSSLRMDRLKVPFFKLQKILMVIQVDI